MIVSLRCRVTPIKPHLLIMEIEKILPKRCIYALKAIFELSFRNSDEPTTIEEIATAQEIPARFLEIILLELKKEGTVNSLRGNEGGFILVVPSSQITIGQIIKLVWDKAKENNTRQKAYIRGDYMFSKVWEKIDFETEKILNNTNFDSLVENEKSYLHKYVPNYVI